MAVPYKHWIDVRDKPGFLQQLMVELAGDARMSLEGDLSKCNFADDQVVSWEETPLLKRSTLSPRLDFVIVKLEPNTILPVFKQVLTAGVKDANIHIQIERNGLLQLGAYDSFHRDCVVTGPEVSANLLASMKASGVVRSFDVATGTRKNNPRWTVGKHQRAPPDPA
jgi:glucose dehydrogenase